MEAMTEKPPRRFRTKPKPLCPKHGVPMIAYSSPAMVRYLICPCPGCGKTSKEAR